ncbi:cell wall hydrolase [Camelimonas abortus]|uniref:Cell wall hydrolase n=1 Tax=Camelimonas abortus TaxID=1017184 RepID=A0ABV7LI00_9HYPH
MAALAAPAEAPAGDVIRPRAALKRELTRGPAPRFPEAQRARKGPPLRPQASLSRAALDAAALRARTAASALLFSRNERLLPGTVLMEGAVEIPDLDEIRRFEAADDDDGATARQTTESSPAADATDLTGAAAAEPETAEPGRLSGAARRAARLWRKPADARDGGTPSVPRAMALASATPAPPEAVPVEVAAAPVIPGRGDSGAAFARARHGRPDYASLISPDRLEREQRCLAEAVYFEARSEPPAGQAAVAQVVLNRVKSGLYPRSICGVVYQNRHRYLGCQFTFACEGKRLVPTETAAWSQAVRIAREVYSGQLYLASVGEATHYHANYVRPRWARKLKKNDVIGRHIFYQLRPGQT